MTAEYDFSDGASELHSQRLPEFRWVKCSTERGERIPIYDANRQPNINSVIGYLSTGNRVTLAGNKISNYVRISEPINGYVNANELTLIQPNIEECNQIFAQEIDGGSYNNRVNLGIYLIKQEVFPYIFSERRSISNYRMMRYGEEIRLPPGSEIAVTDTRVFRNQIFDQEFDTSFLKPGEDPNEHGWLKVEVKFPEGAYEGYIEYKYVDIPNSRSQVSSNAELECYVTRNTNLYEGNIPNRRQGQLRVQAGRSVSVLIPESDDFLLRLNDLAPLWIPTQDVDCGRGGEYPYFQSTNATQFYNPTYCNFIFNTVDPEVNFVYENPNFYSRQIKNLAHGEQILTIGAVYDSNNNEWAKIDSPVRGYVFNISLHNIGRARGHIQC